MENEFAFPICKRGNKISRGRTTTGTPNSVVVPLNSCPKGSKPIGVHHLHPSGSPRLSTQDIKEARRLKLDVMCVRAGRKVKCYRLKPKR